MTFRNLFFISILLFSWHQLILFSGGEGFFVTLLGQDSFQKIQSKNVVAPSVALAEDNSEPVVREPELEPEPESVQEKCGDYNCYTGEEFVEIFNLFEDSIDQTTRGKYVYNHPEADPYIQKIAEDRGYEKRTFADEDRLVWYEGKQTYPEVRDSFAAMKEEMAESGMHIHFVSGYRSSTHQRQLFSKKVGAIDLSRVKDGLYDTQIDNALKLSALPGYSKHHSGYAVDVGCGTSKLVFQFAETPCYEWMSENNFENAKRFGFIPSYPYETPNIGPNPEPWEFVYVGTENL
jgi:hypothetical protein